MTPRSKSALQARERPLSTQRVRGKRFQDWGHCRERREGNKASWAYVRREKASFSLVLTVAIATQGTNSPSRFWVCSVRISDNYLSDRQVVFEGKKTSIICPAKHKFREKRGENVDKLGILYQASSFEQWFGLLRQGEGRGDEQEAFHLCVKVRDANHRIHGQLPKTSRFYTSLKSLQKRRELAELFAAFCSLRAPHLPSPALRAHETLPQ